MCLSPCLVGFHRRAQPLVGLVVPKRLVSYNSKPSYLLVVGFLLLFFFDSFVVIGAAVTAGSVLELAAAAGTVEASGASNKTAPEVVVEREPQTKRRQK